MKWGTRIVRIDLADCPAVNLSRENLIVQINSPVNFKFTIRCRGADADVAGGLFEE